MSDCGWNCLIVNMTQYLVLMRRLQRARHHILLTRLLRVANEHLVDLRSGKLHGAQIIGEQRIIRSARGRVRGKISQITQPEGEGV